MPYKNENYDYIFYRMKDCIPTSSAFYYIITILKLAPLFLLSQSAGYENMANPDPSATFHQYFGYISVTYYVQISMGFSAITTLNIIVLIFNILLILSLLYYLFISAKVQEIEENYGNSSTSEFSFKLFSILAFLKYMMFNQFFYEISFMPLVCASNFVDTSKIASIFSGIDLAALNTTCESNSLIINIVISLVNIIIDAIYNYILVSRFFDLNILSDYYWNTYPNLFYQLLFLEGLCQIFFVMFFNWTNSSYKIFLQAYIYFIVLVHIARHYIKKELYTKQTRSIMSLQVTMVTMTFIAQIIVQIFEIVFGFGPDNINILVMVFVEFVFAKLKDYHFHHNDTQLIGGVISENLNRLNEKNIYQIFTYLITEFHEFSDVERKFEERNLHIFLENYVIHLKSCDDITCPCRHYIRKIEKQMGTHHTKSNHHNPNHTQSHVNFSHLGKDNQNTEEYILNKFFNVLSASTTTSVKYTSNNINLNNIKDNTKERVIYDLRVRLMNAVKKLVFFRMDYLYNNLDGMYSSNFSSDTKHFIRINYFGLQLICNKNYYKTLFLFHEYLSDYQKRLGKEYNFFLIYYFYLKKEGIKEYNEHMSYLKSLKKEPGQLNLDFTGILSECTKFYEIEKKIILSVMDYMDLIGYFENESILFNNMMRKIYNFKEKYKGLSNYIKFFFKNDKITNLFVCSKLILYYKIMNFDIPAGLNNKLVIQSQEEDAIKISNNDSSYNLISVYRDGQFYIKFVSHELLIILEYSGEELRGQDFHMLMPASMRNVHKDLLINEIKFKNNHNLMNKEVFLVGKKRTCIVFDLHFKIMIDLKGEITVLSILNLKKVSNDLKSCFVCIDEVGSVLTNNKEFEENMILSMRTLDYVQIDVEKVLLQNLGTKIRAFFKEEENYSSEYFEKFDYELYLNSLFGEEFETLKDKNELFYMRKLSKWQGLKELVEKGRNYNKYIDIFVRMRVMNNDKFYFVKYLVKSNLNVKLYETSETTISVINAVKISKKEMAKFSAAKFEDEDESFTRSGSINQQEKEDPKTKKKTTKNEEEVGLLESQSAIQSTAATLKANNNKRTFANRKNRFKFASENNNNILLLTIFLIGLCLCSIFYNIISLVIKLNLLSQLHDIMLLSTNTYLLKNSLFYLSSGIINLAFLNDNILRVGKVPQSFKSFSDNTLDLVNFSMQNVENIIYNINYYNNIYYNVSINDLLTSTNQNFTFIFNNGLIFKKTENLAKVITYNEISSLHIPAYEIISDYSTNSLDIHFSKYILFENIQNIQNLLTEENILSDDDLFLFYIINNLFNEIEPFLDDMKIDYYNYLTVVEVSNRETILTLKIIEIIIILFIIMMELIFIYFGYEKTKKRMKDLKNKIQLNNVEMALHKIDEYIKFSNTFNIYSLYYISDMELAVVDVDENAEKTPTPGEKKKSIKKEKKEIIKDIKSYKKTNTKSYKDKKERESTELVLLKNLKDKPDQMKTYKKEDTYEKGVTKALKNLDKIKKIKKTGSLFKQSSHSNSSHKFSNKGSKEIGESSHEKTNSSQLASDLLMNLEVPNERFFDHDPKKFHKAKTNKVDYNITSPILEKEFEANQDSDNQYETNPNRYLKPVLRNNTLTAHNQFLNELFGSDSNQSNLNESKNEESNQQLLITEETNPVNMLKKATKKIQWTDQNVKRFYSPEKELNVNENLNFDLEGSNRALPNLSNNLSNNLSQNLSNNVTSQRSNNLNKKSDTKQRELKIINLNVVQEPKEEVKSKGSLNSIKEEEPVTPSPVEDTTHHPTPTPENDPEENNQGEPEHLNTEGGKILDKGKSKIEHNEFMNMNLKDYKLIRDNTYEPVRRKIRHTQPKPKEQRLDEFGEVVKVEEIVHSNLSAKVILLIFTICFLILYILNILNNLNLYNELISLQNSSLTWLEKIQVLNGLILKYKFNMISNSTSTDLAPQFKKVYTNQNSLIKIMQLPETPMYTRTFTLINQVDSNYACDYLSQPFSTLFNSTLEYEQKECALGGDQMNKNGLDEAYKNILNTMHQLNTDMLQMISLERKDILEKLYDGGFFNLIFDMDYTMRKYDILLSNYIQNDFEDFNTSLLRSEELFSIGSILLNIVFAAISMFFIILPIKYVETSISWITKKYLKQ